MTEKQLKKLYLEQGKSAATIARELNTTASKVTYQLKKLGIPLRSRSEAQANAIAKGVVVHPTKGKKRTNAEKIKISEGRANYWVGLSDEEREEQSKLLSNARKQRWEEATDEERERNKKALAEGLRRSAKEGSKLEKSLLAKLRAAGYNVDYHATGLVNDPNMEVDMWIPKLRMAIEIDGPAHFLPIWGEENLKKNQAASAAKNGMILGYGLVMLRVKNLDRHISEKKIRDVCDAVLDVVKKVEKKYPPAGQRLIEIET